MDQITDSQQRAANYNTLIQNSILSFGPPNHVRKLIDELTKENKRLKKIMETNKDWAQYKRKGLSEMRPYVVGEDVTNVSISQADLDNGSPLEGDMIARNPKNHDDQWLVAKKYFDDNLEPA